MIMFQKIMYLFISMNLKVPKKQKEKEKKHKKEKLKKIVLLNLKYIKEKQIIEDQKVKHLKIYIQIL